jgi:hypothetical protein
MNVLIFENYTRPLGIPTGVEQDARDGKVELWNAARPFPAHETYQGEFIHGVFYGIIYPDQDYADEYRERAQRLDAHRVEFVSKETVMEYGRKVAEEYGADPSDWDYKDILASYIGMRRRQAEQDRN